MESGEWVRLNYTDIHPYGSSSLNRHWRARIPFVRPVLLSWCIRFISEYFEVQHLYSAKQCQVDPAQARILGWW